MLGKLKGVAGKAKALYEYAGGFVAILKAVLEAVEAFEKKDTDDDKKNGEAKKQAVLDTLEVFYEEADDFVNLPLGKDKVLKIGDKLIEIAVNFYKVIGYFK